MQPQFTQPQPGMPEVGWDNNFTRELCNTSPNYRGMHPHFNDIGIGDLLGKWVYEYLFSLGLSWNAFFRSDARWLTFGAIIVVFYGALVKKVIDDWWDWMRGE